MCTIFFPVSRLLGRSSFGGSFGRVDYDASENIQETMILGGVLIWNVAAVCGGRMEFKILVGD